MTIDVELARDTYLRPPGAHGYADTWDANLTVRMREYWLDLLEPELAILDNRFVLEIGPPTANAAPFMPWCWTPNPT
jgi:hypothetical protein